MFHPSQSWFLLAVLPACGVEKPDPRRKVHTIAIQVNAPSGTYTVPLKVPQGDVIRVVVTGFNPFVHAIRIQGESVSYQGAVPSVFSAKDSGEVPSSTPPSAGSGEIKVAKERTQQDRQIASLLPQKGLNEDVNTLLSGKTSADLDALAEAVARKLKPPTAAESNDLRLALESLAPLAHLGKSVEDTLADASLGARELRAAVIKMVKARLDQALNRSGKEITRNPTEGQPDFGAYRALLERCEAATRLPEAPHPNDKARLPLLQAALKEHRAQLESMEVAWRRLAEQPLERVHAIEAFEDEIRLTVEVETKSPKQSVLQAGPYHIAVRRPFTWRFGAGVALAQVEDEAFRYADGKIQRSSRQGELKPVLGGWATFAMPLRQLAWGPTIGIGSASGSRTNYFAGISLVFPIGKQHFTLTGGLAATYRKELDPAYEVGGRLPEGMTAVPLQENLRVRPFFAISYLF